MKTATRIFIVSTILFNFQFLVSNSLQAQTDTTGGVYHESVVVVGDYNPVLDGVTEKVNVAPAVNENAAESFQPRFDYSITPRRISSLTATSGIKAAKVLGSPTRLYNNYMRFGIGHDFAAFADINPLVDLYYTSLRHEDYSYGARLYHNTDITTFGREDEAVPSPDHYGRTRQTVNKLDVFGKYILNKQHLFSAALSFDREYGRYYGFSDSVLYGFRNYTRDSISYRDYAFTYNNLALNLGAKSLNTDDGKLGYEADVDLADFWGRYYFNQASIDFDANVHYGFPVLSKYKAITYLRFDWQGYKQRFNAPATGDDMPLHYYSPVVGLPINLAPDSVNAGRHLVLLNPYVDFLVSGFKFHAGLAFGFNGFDDPERTTHNLFPDISVAKTFANNALGISVGFKGGYEPNDWNSLRLMNPYVAPAPNSLATVSNDLYATMRFNFSKKLILNVSVENSVMRNAMFFKLHRDYALRNIFQPYYVDCNELMLGADFTFVNDEMITMTLGGNYSLNYNVPDNVILLYSPDFTAHLDADVNYKDKWLFELRTLFVSSMDAESVIGINGLNKVTKTLPARFGVSVGAEYMHSRALSFFAKIDNITCQRYFLWTNYPAQRFNLMLGLTYTLPNK